MKIGILTFHRPINYGAFLQSYCLSSALIKHFPNSTVEIIDYIAPKENRKIYLDILRDLYYYGFSTCLKSIDRLRVFRRSLRYLPLSQGKLIGTELKKLFAYIDNHYDVLVIGSDAIFNWNQTEYPTAYIPNYNFHIPVLSYAASAHGLKFYDVEQKIIDECSKVFSAMQYVGVRDTNTENFVLHCNQSVTPVHCCDPTFLFNKVDLPDMDQGQRIKKKYALSLNESYIVLMVADSELSKQIAQKYKGKHRIIALFKPSAYADLYIHDADPFEWTQVLKNAALVVTSYFHGTLLSLVQNTPVLVVDHAGMEDSIYQSKLYDVVVDRLQLSDLYCTRRDIETENSNFDALLQKTDRMLNGEYSEAIRNAVQRESNYFETFVVAIDQLMEKEL